MITHSQGSLMQTHRQSVLEVSIDYVFSLLVNIGGQMLVYGRHATAGRMTLLALPILLSVYPRRFATRRLFNALLPEGVRQPRWHSVLEVLSDTALGFLIAIALQVIIYGSAATLVRAGGLTALIYAVALLRRYILRRIFVSFDMQEARVRRLLSQSVEQTPLSREALSPTGNLSQVSQLDRPASVP
jgi:hypothetical protein